MVSSLHCFSKFPLIYFKISRRIVEYLLSSAYCFFRLIFFVYLYRDLSDWYFIGNKLKDGEGLVSGGEMNKSTSFSKICWSFWGSRYNVEELLIGFLSLGKRFIALFCSGYIESLARQQQLNNPVPGNDSAIAVQHQMALTVLIMVPAFNGSRLSVSLKVDFMILVDFKQIWSTSEIHEFS